MDPPVHGSAIRCASGQLSCLSISIRWATAAARGFHCWTTTRPHAHVALHLFSGLVVFLVPLQASITSVVRSGTSISFAEDLVTDYLPIIYLSCPYKISLSLYIFPLYTYIAFTAAIPPMYRYWAESSSVPEKTHTRALREAVEHGAYEMEANALSWSFCTSFNPSV